ncbi:MAG: tetratricopeptide repeat protein [Deltaproteobacteria bacterium]|nr:tetratricopeptide repeat protein [Deltaproteobacteria bacterium]
MRTPAEAGAGPSPTPARDTYAEAAREQARAALFGEDIRGPARRYGRYRVVAPLGEGGMGTVLLAHDETLDREVALKLLHPAVAVRQERRLLREAQALARLSHPHVVQVFEVGKVDERLFIAMERVTGQTLHAWHAEARPWRECVALYLQAGRGLVAAHAVDLVHRDFKPANCIVDDEGRVRVLDFGLACDVRQPQSQGDDRDAAALQRDALAVTVTRTGAAVGTAAYMPPEQWEGGKVGPWSDQFGFCVSLFEAVWGVRPFEGATVAASMEAIDGGRMRPAPPGSSAPAWLRAVLRRGVVARPADRWPSMDALLTALERGVQGKRRRRRWLGWTATSLGAGAIGWVALWAEPAVRCDGASARLAGVWDRDRAQAVEDALRATAAAPADDAWTRVQRHLDDYAEQWVTRHEQACEATHVEGEPATRLDLRMRCLDRGRLALRETVDVLTQADAALVPRAVEMVTALPSPAHCLDVGPLRAATTTPEDPGRAAQVESIRASLARAAALRGAGRFDASMELLSGAVPRAEALGDDVLHAEALQLRGLVARERGEYPQARRDHEQAYLLARAVGHDRVATEAAAEMIYVLGRRLGEVDEALGWGRLVIGLAVASNDARAHARALTVMGLVRLEAGDIAGARADLERALVLVERDPGLDHPDALVVLGALASVLKAQGERDRADAIYERILAALQRVLGPSHPRFGGVLVNRAGGAHGRGKYLEARQMYDRALPVLEAALGPEHPAIATTLTNRGNTLERLGLPREALESHQRAQAIREQVLGPEHPHVAEALLGVAISLTALHRLDQAREACERSVRIFEAHHGPRHLALVGALNQLGVVLGHMGEHERADRFLRRALAVVRTGLGPTHSTAGAILVAIGTNLRQGGDLDGAVAPLEEALAIHEKTRGLDHPHVAITLVQQAELALARGERPRAEVAARRAVEIGEAMGEGMAALPVADARWALARALGPNQRHSARRLARQALEVYASQMELGEQSKAEVEAWLDAPPG